MEEGLKPKLIEGLRKLPDRERTIVVLYYFEGITFAEIAAAMGVSNSRISQLHARALRLLIPCLEGEEDALPA